uniref:sodium-coupled monocarboxylate transporter 1-like isoform X1 n=1 Tax=Styela clava TaxID=7725 RepID=UPI00193A24D8|nr:sodium-coupled monocarboxylate transporter 1-like isoform X1 [Styela clava]
MDEIASVSKKDLGIADYVSFAALLSVSCIIGIYYAYRDRRNSTTSNYYFGDRKINAIAVGLSIAVTFRSSVTVIASPAESYITGTAVLWSDFAIVIIAFITMIYFIPAFRRMQLNTIFEFLELRFSLVLARIAACMYTFGTIFYMGSVVYLPAVSLNAVTSIPLEWSIILTGGICTLYTTLGGMKAVIWNDVFQSIIMIAGMFAVTIQGLITIGGVDKMMDALERGGRYTAMKFEYGIISRVSPAAILVGNFVMAMDVLCFSQTIIQRYLSCKSTRQAQFSLLVYLLPTLLITLATFVNGFIMYTYYEGCDPVLSGKLQKIDQGIPYLAMELFENIPGMAGLFISAIFSASLSTVSSSLNSLSVVLLEDFFVKRWPNMTESIKLLTGKISVVVIGTLVIINAFVISIVRSNALELVYGFTGLIYGPLVGIFILGFFFPWTNKYGAVIGVFSGYVMLSFIFLGNHIWNENPYSENVPLRTIDSCPTNNVTSELFLNTTTSMPNMLSTNTEVEHSVLLDILNINFNFLMFLGCSVAIVMGLLFSFLTGHTPGSKANPIYFIPLVDNKRLPVKVRKFFRFGVPELLPVEKKISSKTDSVEDVNYSNKI